MTWIHSPHKVLLLTLSVCFVTVMTIQLGSDSLDKHLVQARPFVHTLHCQIGGVDIIMDYLDEAKEAFSLLITFKWLEILNILYSKRHLTQYKTCTVFARLEPTGNYQHNFKLALLQEYNSRIIGG